MSRTVRTARVSAERDGVNSDDRDGVGWSSEVAGKSMVGRQPETPSHRSGKRGGASAGTSQRRRRVDDVLLLLLLLPIAEGAADEAGYDGHSRLWQT